MLNGDGLRVVLWVAGCNHCCRECQNPITWDPNGGLPFTEAEEAEIFTELDKDYIGGIYQSGQQLAGRGFGKTQQNVGRLDLDALAGSRLDLQRRVGLAQDGGGFEGAVFFEQYMHRPDYNPQYSKSCGSKAAKRVKL